MSIPSDSIHLPSLKQLRTDESAFTLFELLVVCALISVMLAVTVPTLRNTLLTDSLKSSSRQIVGMIKGTRELAIREQQAYLIYFDLTNRSIWVEQEAEKGLDELEEEDKKILQLPGSVRFLDVWTSGEGKLESGRPALLISRQGYMDQTMIHLGDDDDEVLSLLFSPFLGNVQVFDSYAELD
jgi:type II secretory pathway pseudopilin PulG